MAFSGFSAVNSDFLMSRFPKVLKNKELISRGAESQKRPIFQFASPPLHLHKLYIIGKLTIHYHSRSMFEGVWSSKEAVTMETAFENIMLILRKSLISP